MQFIDLSKQQKLIRERINARIESVLDHGQYINGKEVFELEELLVNYVDKKHCISCSSGTDALLIPLMAYGIGPGDAVITTPFTYIATAEVIAILGATPIFVDIYEKTFNINPDGIEEAIKFAKIFMTKILKSVKNSPKIIMTKTLITAKNNSKIIMTKTLITAKNNF